MSKLEKVEKAIEKGKEAALIKLAHDKDEEVKLAAIAAWGRSARMIPSTPLCRTCSPMRPQGAGRRRRSPGRDAERARQRPSPLLLRAGEGPRRHRRHAGGHCQPGRGLTPPISQKKRGRPAFPERERPGAFFAFCRVSPVRGKRLQAGADLPAQPQELLLFLGGEGLVQAVLHLADAAADALVQLDGPGGSAPAFSGGRPAPPSCG